MTPIFGMPATAEVLDLFREIVGEMVESFGIPEAEAVARINRQWWGQEFLQSDELVLHESPEYWAFFIYYEEVPDWRPGADRSEWKVKDLPDRDLGYWETGV